jgi:hypothetical protein
MNASTVATNIYTKVSESARRLHAVDAALALTALWAVLTAVRAARRRLKTTQLRGPPNPSLLYGVGKDVAEATDSGALMYEAWAEEYGVVYQVPATLGQTKIVLTDPRAIAHFYARETWTYVLTPLSKALFERGVCEISVLYASCSCFPPVVRKGFALVTGRKPPKVNLPCLTAGDGGLLNRTLYRQRKSLTPAFSNAAIRKLAPIFYDSVYKVRQYVPL